MKPNLTLLVGLILAASSGAVAAAPSLQLAQNGCAAVAQQVAAAQGGQVIGAPRAVQQNGQTMCVVTILIRDPDGARPPVRRQVTVPAR